MDKKNIEAFTNMKLFKLNRSSMENLQENISHLYEGQTKNLSKFCKQGSQQKKNSNQRSQISSHEMYDPLEATLI